MNNSSPATVPVLYRLRHRITKEWHPNGALYAPGAIEHGRKLANHRTWHETNHDVSNAWEGVPGCSECGHHVMGFAKGEYNGYCRSCTLKATRLQTETSRALPVDFGSPEMIAQVVPASLTNPVFGGGPAITVSLAQPVYVAEDGTATLDPAKAASNGARPVGHVVNIDTTPSAPSVLEKQLIASIASNEERRHRNAAERVKKEML